MPVRDHLEKMDRIWILTLKGFQNIFLNKNRKGNSTRVFVSGIQRSGTNMIMDVLERSMETDTYHERDNRAFDNYQMKDRKIIHQLIESSTSQLFVIKSLCESQYLRSLMDEFEPSKALWVVRHFDDTVNSLMISFSGFAERIKLIAKDRNSCGWRGRGMSNETHEIIRKFADNNINEATAAALKWYYRNILYFEQQLENDPRVKLIFYEKLVTDPVDEIKEISDFLGLKYHRRVHRWVSPRSIRRRLPPEIDSNVRELCSALLSRFHKLHTAS